MSDILGYHDRVLGYRIDIERDGDVFIASVPSLPGCMSHGETVEEALENAREAIRCYTESMRQHGEELPSVDVA